MLDSDGQSVRFQLDKAQQAAEFMRTAFRQGVYAPGFNTMTLEEARRTFQSGQVRLDRPRCATIAGPAALAGADDGGDLPGLGE